MEGSKKTRAGATTSRLDKYRTQFRTLIVSNPNYFGNFPATKFKPVKTLIQDSSYEELTELGYNPRLKQLTATFSLKKGSGYGGNLCSDGSREYVRFYVNRGSGWEDAGLAGSDVHDIPLGKDCADKSNHPLSYSVEVAYSPARKWCTGATTPESPRNSILEFRTAGRATQLEAGLWQRT